MSKHAVAWMAGEGDDEYDGAKCDACGQDVPVRDGNYDAHACPMQMDVAGVTQKRMCDGSGTACKADSVTLRGGKWVVLPKSGGEVLGIYGSREEAEAQERALSSRNSDDDEESARAEYEAMGRDDDYDPDQPRAENGEWGEGGAGTGGGEKSSGGSSGGGSVSTGEAKARAAFHGPKEHAHSPEARTAWYKEQTAKMKGERQALKKKTSAVKKATKKDEVRRYERLDFATGDLPRARVTPEGFLEVTGRVARTGIQEYRDGQGGTRRELRLPEEVEKSLPSFPLRPMTNLHPSEMVDPDNAQKYVTGAVGEAKLNADGWVTSPLSIWRADAIAAARNGRVQLSVGYTCRLDAAPGEWRGQRYDAIQRDIVVNHVALVDMARAGSDARMRLDNEDAVACDTGTRESLDKGDVNMAKLVIDGMTFEVADANAQAAYDGFVARMNKQCDEKVATANLAKENEAKLRTTAEKERDAIQGKHDAKMAEDRQPLKLDGQEIAIADALDPVKFDAWVTPISQARAHGRASLLVEARKHLGANEKFDAHKGKDGKDVAAKSDTEIKRLVVMKLDQSAKLDGKSDEYIQARYDAAVERSDKNGRSVDTARTVTAPTLSLVQDDQEPDPVAARKAMEARMLAANVRSPKYDANGKV